MSPMVRSDGRTFRQELRGHADAIAAEGAATDCFPREGSITEHLLRRKERSHVR